MGYRSEVAIKCEEKAFKMLKETYDRVNFAPHKVYKDEDCFILYWDWVKWFDCYDDVSAIEDVMSKLDQLDDTEGYGYRFMRLGENDDDIETRENDYNIELWMIRKIDIPEGLEEIVESEI